MLQIIQPVKQAIDGLRWADTDQAGDSHLQNQTRTAGTRDLIVHVKHHMEGPHQHICTAALDQTLKPLALIGRHIQILLRPGTQPNQGGIANQGQHL